MEHVRILSLIAVLACVFMCSCSTVAGMHGTRTGLGRAVFPGLPPIRAQVMPRQVNEPVQPVERQREIELAGIVGLGVFLLSDNDLEDIFGSSSIAPSAGMNLWFNDNVVGRGELEFHTWEGQEGFGDFKMDNYVMRLTGHYLPTMNNPSGGPYFGAGLCIYMTEWWYERPIAGFWLKDDDSETDVGLSVLAGYRFKMQSGNSLMMEILLDIVRGKSMDEHYDLGGLAIKAIFEF